MKTTRVRVRRDRPSALSWAIALAVTMLIVYLLTLNAGQPDVVESVSAAPRITQAVAFDALEMYLVSLQSCPTAEQARMQAAGFTARGAAGYIYEDGDTWRVLGAAYASQRDAQRIAQRLIDDEGISAEVISLEADAVNMRITAPEAQITAIVAIDELLRAQTQQLGDIALQLDRDEIRPDAARTLCAVAATEADEAARALSSIPGAGENGLCAALIERAEVLTQMLDAISESDQDANTDLSGMLRCAQIENFIGQCQLQLALTNG